MKRMQAENVSLDGTPVMTVVKVEMAPSAEQASAAPKQEESRPSGLGGRGGRRGRRASGGGDDKAAAAPGGRTLVMTFQNELLKASPAVVDSELAIAAEFKLR
jgi:hypothetical protein